MSRYRGAGHWKSPGKGWYSSLALALLLVSTVMPFIGSRAVTASPPAGPGSEEWPFRFDLFQMLLEQKGLKPVTDVAEAFDHPETTVIVAVGRIDSRFPIGRIPEFIQRGTMLIATDQTFHYPALFQVTAGRVYASRVADRYQNFGDCIRVTDFPATGTWSSGMSEIILNRAGWISSLSSSYGDWQIDARLPEATQPLPSGGRPVLASLTSSQAARPHLFVASDQSLLANGMMWHGDNALLAIKLGSALCGQGQTRLLFLVDGQPQASYLQGPLADQIPPIPPDAPLPEEMPELEIEQVLKLANAVATKVEDNDLANRALIDRPRSISDAGFRNMWVLAVLFAMVATLVYFLLMRGYAGPSSTVTPRRMMSAGEMTEPGRRGMAERGATAKLIAQDFLFHATGSHDPQDWRKRLSTESFPSIDSRTLEHLAYLQSLAQNERVPLLSERKLKELGRMLDEVREFLSTHPLRTGPSTRT